MTRPPLVFFFLEFDSVEGALVLKGFFFWNSIDVNISGAKCNLWLVEKVYIVLGVFWLVCSVTKKNLRSLFHRSA